MWDAQRMIAVLKDAQDRFDDALAKAEHLFTKHKTVESELRAELQDSKQSVEQLQSQLDSLSAT